MSVEGITVTEEWVKKKDGYVWTRRKIGMGPWGEWEMTPHFEIPYVTFSYDELPDPTPPLDELKEKDV